MIDSLPKVFEEAKRLFSEFDPPHLLLAGELHDQTFSLWRPNDFHQMGHFFSRPTRVALCFIRHAMIVDPNVTDMLPLIEQRWRSYMTDIIYPPLDTPLTACLAPIEETPPATPEKE